MGNLEVRRVAFIDEKPAIRSIRVAVFVKEQGVPLALEMDQQDLLARHALAYWQGEPVGTGRLLPDGHIGRVAVLAPFRGRGIGEAIMRHLLDWAKEEGLEWARLASQIHAEPFYERLGFQRRGEPYVEVGIEHVDMQRPLR